MAGRVAIAVAVALALLGAGAARAQAQDPAYDLAVLNGSDFSNAEGNIAVNAAAGANNQQANIAVVAKGDTSLGSAALIQFLETGDGSGQRQMSALITDGAFANSSGLIAVNVAAGSDNQQGNLALLSMAGAGQAVADIVLSQSRASRDPTATDAGVAEVSAGQTLLSSDAFANSSGVVQLSIIGGERNSSANLFALSVQGGANP